MAGGSPFLATAALWGLVQGGALTGSPDGWRLGVGALQELQTSRQAAVVLARRIGRLPASMRSLLEVAAVMGRSFEPTCLAELAGQSPTEVLATLRQAREHHLAWPDADGSRWHFAHDLLRQKLLEVVPADDQRRLHRAIAQGLVDQDGTRSFAIAYHLDAAGAGAKSLPYALQAAREARRRHGLEVAESQLRIADRAGAALENANKHAKLEAALSSLHDAHRALRDTQAQLIHAGKMSALGQLGAGIAHALSQPLAAIQGFAQRLCRQPRGSIADHAQELAIIDRASQRMAGILEGIRTFARMAPVEPAWIDPLAPVKEALSLVGAQLRSAGIEVHLSDGAVPLPRVRADQAQLQQVYLNLLLNARDALATVPRDRPRRIDIDARVEGEWVVWRLSDSGPGVPSALEDRIFEPFFSTKENGEGLGLGLSISKGIVTEHGGRMGYDPAPGGGASFSVRLPTKGGAHQTDT